jgi:hypothetical protein
MELGLVGHGVNQLPLSQREVRFAKYLPGRHGSLTPPAAAPQSAANTRRADSNSRKCGSPNFQKIPKKYPTGVVSAAR